LAHGLAPVNLGATGLGDALGALAARTTEIARIQCTFHAASAIVIDDALIAGHLFRITQEAVNNAVKHSRASEIAIRLSQHEGTLRLIISDNGRGLSPRGKNAQGIGLQMMKHRASVIGAELSIDSKPDQGVTVTCSRTAPT
jgi:signal transduction histidine kinase